MGRLNKQRAPFVFGLMLSAGMHVFGHLLGIGHSARGAAIVNRSRWSGNVSGLLRFASIVAVSVVAIAAAGCAAEERAQSPREILGNGGENYVPPVSLDTVVEFSDVIARVELLSVSSVVEPILDSRGELKWYGKSLHHRLQVLEYLKGDGGQEMVAIVINDAQHHRELQFATAEEAEELGPDLIEERISEWDDREAIVFVQRDVFYLPSTQEDDTYLIGAYSPSGFGWVGMFDNEIMRKWLPIARAGDTGNFIMDVLRNREGDDRLFLTEIPREQPNPYGLGPYRDSRSTQVPGQISVRELKEKIRASEERVEATPTPTPVPAPEWPREPRVTVQLTAPRAVLVDWPDVAAADSYEVSLYASNSDDFVDFVLLSTNSPVNGITMTITGTSAEVNNLPTGEGGYFFRVRAWNDAGESEWSFPGYLATS